MKLHTLLSAGAVFATVLLFWLNPSVPVTSVAPSPSVVTGYEKTAIRVTSMTKESDKIIGVLKPREELIGVPGEHTDNLFRLHSWAPPPPPVVHIKAIAPPKPVAPPVPFSYLGKKFENGVWEVYLARGNETFVVREKSMIDGTYRAESVHPPVLTLIFLPLKQQQTLPIGEGH